MRDKRHKIILVENIFEEYDFPKNIFQRKPFYVKSGDSENYCYIVVI